MHRFPPAGLKWWQKPLVLYDGRPLPAELAVLRLEARSDERGWWLNSRGTSTGAVDLVRAEDGFATQREPLPKTVSSTLEQIYADPEVARGVYDLVFFRPADSSIRFVEVKCPHWDQRSPDQEVFAQVLEELGIQSEIVEWEFTGSSPEAP